MDSLTPLASPTKHVADRCKPLKTIYMKKWYLVLGIIFSGVCILKAEEDKGNYVLIGDSTNAYPTINSILKLDYFDNKVVYIDIWGTRCGPCLREFKHLKPLKKRFNKDSIVFLYLSSPYSERWDDNNAERWKELIYKHKLTGVNILMSAECYVGFFKRYKDKYENKEMYAIPTYLLVDRNGKIVDFKAPRPSERVKLFREIELLLDN